MRSLNHHCAGWDNAVAGQAVLYCSCGCATSSPAALSEAVDAFTAHVLAAVLIDEARGYNASVLEWMEQHAKERGSDG